MGSGQLLCVDLYIVYFFTAGRTLNSSLLAQIEILTHPNTLSKSQTNTITTISRLPNLHISQNCIRLLLAIDKMNSRVRKKSLNHCGPSGLSDSDTTFHAAERSCQETRPLSNRPLSLEFLCSCPLEGWPCHYPGKVSSCLALPHFSDLTALLHLRAKPFPQSLPRSPNSLECVSCTLFLIQMIDGHFCYHLLSIMNNANMYILIHILWYGQRTRFMLFLLF